MVKAVGQQPLSTAKSVLMIGLFYSGKNDHQSIPTTNYQPPLLSSVHHISPHPAAIVFANRGAFFPGDDTSLIA